MDCSPFLNWSEDADETIQEKAVVFQSLVATLKLQPALDEYLETKAAQFLESVRPEGRNSADAFLGTLASNSDKSSPDFVQSILGLISFPSQAVTTAAIKMLDSLFDWCSAKYNLTLVNADLIPQLINTLHPLSLSFSEAVDVHICLSRIIAFSLWLTTTDGLSKLETKDDDEDQAVYETVLQQVLVPSEMYIWHLCANSFSMINEDQSMRFLKLLARLLQVSPVYHPTMDCVLNMPEIVSQMLRMEGIEDVFEEKLHNDQNEYFGGQIVDISIGWNNLRGANLPRVATLSFILLRRPSFTAPKWKASTVKWSMSGISSSVQIEFFVGTTGTSFRTDRSSRLSKRAPIADWMEERKW
ncbi:hypothetical protein BLNAU_14584 [Blattamonas nauphoetae]|uniref:Uncharacterized protein n=1 Tax=Blattamonas nauphoetae TaxID=2049346 RepID=A0ABQ9XD86_9EUKA|nr:hypothetical protein BLNAU_14584 [Blattamonas nauphoetae]